MRETRVSASDGVGWARATVSVVVVAAGAVACSAASSGREGDLGQGTFSYQCLTDQDPICPSGASTMSNCSGYTTTSNQCFPSAIAVGGRFRIQYTAGSSSKNAGNPVLRTVSNDFLQAFGDGQFKGLKPGYVGVYSQSTVDSSVIDYTMVKIEPIATLRIIDSLVKSGVAPSISLAVGGMSDYSLVASGASGSPLAGAVESFLWETSDSAIAELTQAANTAKMRVHAVAPGTATITAYADPSKTVKASFKVTVQ